MIRLLPLTLIMLLPLIVYSLLIIIISSYSISNSSNSFLTNSLSIENIASTKVFSSPVLIKDFENFPPKT